MLMVVAGPKNLAGAAAAAILCAALVVALVVPRLADCPLSRVGVVFTAIFGLLEIFGVLAALAGERVALHGSGGLAFGIPRSMLDADHKFVDLGSGARIHYVDVGTGPALLFLNGNPSWLFQWRDLIRGLHSSF